MTNSVAPPLGSTDIRQVRISEARESNRTEAPLHDEVEQETSADGDLAP
eukprot:CAMPEP_0194536224 /NCGR_PEP_ID=MMETSP0253-20130528/75065_1 /TAXON_ID=2966 /ORGANISM="Noctiluca scintillans" /LENGTH=48 /DNA_ID= /DNA_START= /DNA_END= /DNA_ORIENTATION=